MSCAGDGVGSVNVGSPLAAGRRVAKLVEWSMGLSSSGAGLSCLEAQSGPQRPWGCTPATGTRVAVVVIAAGCRSRSSAAEGPTANEVSVDDPTNRPVAGGKACVMTNGALGRRPGVRGESGLVSRSRRRWV